MMGTVLPSNPFSLGGFMRKSTFAFALSFLVAAAWFGLQGKPPLAQVTSSTAKMGISY
jgi:hypothetical protein